MKHHYLRLMAAGLVFLSLIGAAGLLLYSPLLKADAARPSRTHQQAHHQHHQHSQHRTATTFSSVPSHKSNQGKGASGQTASNMSGAAPTKSTQSSSPGTNSTISTAGSQSPSPTPNGANPTPTNAPNPTPPTSTQNNSGPFQLIYSDDFNGAQLDPTWGLYNGPHGGGNSYYDPSEVSVSNGMVHLRMEQKSTGGRPYTTGGMAAFKLAQTYGKYEFSAKLPLGKGVGPYAILWPNDSGHGDVEVDLFESPPPMKDKVYFTNHGNGSPTQIVASGNFGSAFHTFSYEWTPGKLDFQIDGVEQGTLTQNVPNFPMWFGIAVSSGDAFTGSPDSSTVLPVSLDVDWVRIYKYTG